MKEWVYKHKTDGRRFIELRRYDDGHFVWKKLKVTFDEFGDAVNTYLDCPDSKSEVGVWNRVSKKKMLKVLEDYNCIIPCRDK